MDKLSYSITGGINVVSIEVFEGYGQQTAKCTIVTDDYGALDLGDSIEVSIGYEGSTSKVFTGYIQDIRAERMPGLYTIEAQDVLIKAVEYMIVSTDLDNPFRRWNISMEDLVRDLLALAGITNYTGDASSFTLATGEVPAEFQFVSVMDAVNQVASIIAWHCYADHNGHVYFKDIKPIPSGSPVASFTTGTSGNLVQVSRHISTDNLRNKVVVIGRKPIVAEASASSPYLPSGFYKTAIIASQLIDTQSMADVAASYNLSAWNRLTEAASVETIGNPNLHARQTVSVTESFTGMSSNWFIYDITHSFGPNTYITRMNLRK